MSTDAQARAEGYLVPQGTDPIRDGDNAISNNARVTLDKITALRDADTTASTAIGKLREFTAVNLLPTGAASSTQWAGTGGALTIAYSTMKVTGNGSAASLTIAGAGANTFAGIGGHRYYVRARTRPTSPGTVRPTSLTVSLTDGTTVAPLDGAAVTVANPAYNTWVNASGIVTLPTSLDGKQITSRSSATYADAATANGQGIELYQAAVIDLTAIYGKGAEPPATVIDGILGPGPTVTWTGSKVLEPTTAGIMTAPRTPQPLRRRRRTTEPAVVLRFDDGYESVWRNAFPVLQRYGYTGTMATCTDPVNWLSAADQKGNGPTMTPAQLHDLADAGWEIASHTPIHEDALARTQQQFAADLDKSITDLVGMGFPIPQTFVYPNGGHDPARDRLVYRRFDRCGVTGGPEANPTRPDRPLFFTGWGTVPGVGTYKAQLVARAKAYVEQSFRRGHVAILGFHDVTRAPTGWSPNLDLATFLNIIQWLDAEGYPVANMRDVGLTHNLLGDPGFNTYPVVPSGFGSHPWVTTGPGGNVAFTRVTTGQESGLAAVNINATSGIAAGLGIAQYVQLDAGQTYRLRARIKVTSATAGALETAVSFFGHVNVNTVAPDVTVATINSVTAGFVDAVAEFTAPTPMTACVRVRAAAGGFTGAGVLDHVQLIPTSTYDPLA